ncbi:hypothetical protein BJ165DRAFT_765799 [Panaeolus papilionaceus]|nr:hypothetical protein BJ165DRAFT_765799 [Panaeolus papilionaceus]
MSFPTTLLPCIPEASSRYLPPSKRVLQEERLIPPAMFSSKSHSLRLYESVSWMKSVHPEGTVYFYKTLPKSEDGPSLDIVADDDAQDPVIGARLTKWAQIIRTLVRDDKASLVHQGHLELYLKVDEDDLCCYYLVDRRAKTIFFLEKHSSADLDLGSIVSDDHLRLSLERQFWIHTEFFPNHFGGISRRELDELTGQFRHSNTVH